jgi:tyrosyl-tRNA synthetase
MNKKNCILQVGGSDQWGNIISGYELIKKKHKHEVCAMTIPLITNA